MFKARTFKAGRTGKVAGRRSPVGLAGPVAMVLCVSALPALAGPRGERVVRGEASFHRQGRNTTITAGNNAIIEYDSFNIRRRQTVEFIQPSAGSRVLNRIVGPDPTSIRGTLRSNGVVYIVNPAGVIFGPGATVDVGGIYAAAGGLSNQDFIAGNDHFTNVQGRVVNRGSIEADSMVGLIGRRVANFGTVVAPEGTVTMVAGDEVWIGERGGHVYARFSTDAAREQAGGVTNAGSVTGNQVLAGVGDYYALAVLDSSYIRAQTVALRAGTGTTTTVAGTIDVSNRAEGGVGGSVTVTGERVALRGAQIDASGDAGGGSVRIGGDFQGGRNGGVDGQAALNNAERTYVAPGTTINADAVTTGDGGTVIVWSDVFTNYNGSITARGGGQGGDGGFAEVSGKDTLVFNGTADLSATDGAQGELLLDPKNITIANGGAAAVASNNEFGENSSSSVSMDADLITAITNTGTAVTLQANNDITINEAITSNNGAGDGGDITLQAGRSINISANITTDNGNFSATANETVANGVVNAQRDAGAAVIDMDNNVVINAGTGDVTLTLSTGAGLTNSTSGNIIVEDITTTGTVTITNNGPTAGSSIVIDGAGGANSLLTAGNLAMIVGGAGGGGSIGTGADPIAFTATNIEASGQSAGVFLDTSSTVNVGGASGSITGLSTAGGGAIDLATGAGNITTSEAITGTGTVTLTGATIGIGANVTGNDDVVLTGPVTITGSRTVSAGAGQLDIVNTVTLSGAGATVTMIGTPSGGTPAITFQDTVSPDAGGSTLVLEQNGVDADFNIATGTDDVLEATNGIDQLQDGFDSIVFGRSDGTVNIGVGAATFIDPVTIRTTDGNINVNGALTGTDDASFTLTPGASSNVRFGLTGTVISTAGGDITINGDARVGEGFTATLDSAGGLISITGDVDGTSGGAGENIVFDAAAGDLTIGGTLGTGQVLGLDDATITDAAAVSIGGVDIEGTFATTNALAGTFTATGSVTADAVNLNGTTFDFDAAVEVLTGAFTIGSTGATSVNFDSTLTSAAGGIDITTTAGQTFDALVSTTGGGDVTLDGGAVTLTGGITTAGANGNVGITNSGLLSIDGAISATGTVTQTDNAGTVTVNANVTGVGVTFNSAVTMAGSREISAGTGALAFNSTLDFSTAAGTGTLTGDSIAFASNVTPNGGGTTLVFQSPSATTDFSIATGLADELISAASIAFLQNGFTELQFGRSNGQHDIQIGAATYQDPVLFQTPTSGDITVTGTITTATNGTVFFDVGASNRIILDVTGNAVVTTGEEINFGGAVRIAEGEAPIIDSANGAIRFGGAVDGTTGGAAESLILDAGAGNIDFQTVASAVSGASGAADATGLATLTITDANNLSIQSILISGPFTTTNALGGAVQALGTVQAGTIDLDADSFDFDAAVTAGAGGIDLTAGNGINFDSTLTAGAGGVNTLGNIHTFDALISTSGGGDVTMNGTAITLTGGITTAGGTANVAITNAGLLTINGDITADGTFTQTNNGGTVSLGADISTASADGTIQFNSAVTATASVTLDSGAGAIDLNSTFAAGANSIIFETNDFQPSAADSVTGTGVVTLRPENISDSIDLGSASTGATATYDLTDLAALADGFSLIRIGHITTGTHAISMQGFNGGAALRDDMVIHAPAGAGQITLLDSTDTGSNDLTFDGVFSAGAASLTIDTGASGQLTFGDDAGFNASDVALVGNVFADFLGAITGSGTLLIQPTTDATAIDVGDVVGAGGALQGGLVITEGDLQTLNDADFTAIEIGIAATGTHSIQLGDTTGATAWNSDVVFHAPAGAGIIRVLGDQLVDTTGNANATGDMTFDGDAAMGAPVTITVEDLLTFEQDLDIDGNDTTLASGDLALNGGANSVFNGGPAATLTLSPADATADIDIGDLGGNAQAGAWSLVDAELAAIDASIGSLAFGTPTTGSHSIFIGLITGLNFDATFNAPLGEIRLHDDITSGGNSLVFNSDVRIANATTPTITTAGGSVAFNFDVFGSTSGAGETLAIDAGTGDVSVAGTISGQSTGVSNSTGLTAVSITANNVDLGSGAGALGAVDITGLLTIDNAGVLDIDDDVFADGGLDQNSTATTGTVTLGADVTSIDSAISFFSDVTLTAAAELSSGTGLVEIGGSSTFDTAGFDLTITSRDIDILGSLAGGDGTNTLTLRPDLATGAIDLGTLTGSTAGALVLDATDLASIADGFGGIEIGFAGTGSHAFLIGDAAFIDPLTLHAPAAGGGFEIEASRTLSGTDDASLTLLGSHATLVLNNGSAIVTAGTDIDIDDNIQLADGAGDSGLNADIPLIDTGAGGGNVTVDGSIFGTDNASTMVERLRINAGTGTITVGDVLTVNGTTTNITGVQAGTASDQGLVDFRIVAASGVTLEGVNIAGGLETESDLTGGFVANEEVLAQSITLGGTTFNFVDGFGATNNGGGAAAFTNSDTVTTTEGEATGDITTTGDMTATRLESDGSIAIGGDLILGDEADADVDITVSGGAVIGDRLVAGNDIDITGDLEFAVNATATRGLFAIGGVTAGGDILTNGQDVVIRAAEADFNGGAGSVQGGGTLTIRPFLSSGDMSFGFAADTGAGVLDLTDTDLAALASGFDAVNFGVAGGTHDMVVSSATFRNASNFNYQAGTMLIEGPVVATLAGADLTFLGADAGGTTLSGNITSNNGASITIDDNVTLGADSVLMMNGGPGTVEIDGTVDGAFGLTILGGSGLVEIDGLIGGGTALASLAVSGDQVNIASGIGTSGAAGVTGSTGITATTSLTLGGENYNTNLAAYQTGGTGSILGSGSGSTATFSSNGANITFDGAGTGSFDIDDGVNLTVNSGGGDINLAVGFEGQAGAILFSGPVVLTGNTSVNNEGPGASSTVTFAETVDGAFDLDVTTAGGSVFFLGDVGTSEALGNLSVDSASDIEIENVGSGADAGVDNLDLTAAGDITFNGTAYAAGGDASFEAGGQHTVASGATTFSTRGGSVAFAGGDIVLIDGSDLTVSTSGGDGTFTSIRGDSDENVTLDLGTGVATIAGIGMGDEIGDIRIVANNINLNGNVFGNTFTLETGSTGRNIEIAGDGSTPSALRLSRQEFARIRDGFSSVTIGRADGQGTIIVGGDGGGALAFNDALSLLNSGAAVSSILVQEEMTGIGADASLLLDSGSVLLSNNISTQGADVTLDAATFLGADASIATDGGDVLFTDAGTIDNITGGGPFGLTIDAGDGSVTVEGDVGLNNQPDDTPLAFTSFTGSTISLQQVSTEGDQTYTGAVTLGGNLTAQDGTILVDGIATLASDITIAAGDGVDSDTADVIFRGNVIGGDNDLVVIADGDASADAAGNAIFDGNVSGLRSLAVVAGVIEAANITTTSQQNYAATDRMELGGTLRATDDGDIEIDGDVVLTANSAINVSGAGGRTSGITIDGTVTSDASSGPFDLALTGAQGDITIRGAVGGPSNGSDALRVDDLTITGPSRVSLQGVRVASSLDIQTRSATLNGPIDSDGRLVASVNETLQTRGTIDVEGNAVFNGLNINLGDDAADAINIDGLLLVGPAVPDEENRTARVTVLAPITVNGGDIPPAQPGEDDTAAMTFNVDRLILRNRLEVTGGDIRIDNAGRFVMDRAESAIELNGGNFDQVGEGNVVLGFAGDTLEISAVRSSRLAFDGPITLAGDVSIRGGRLEFNGGINDDSAADRRALSLTSSRQTVITGDIGAVNPIASLTTAGAGRTLLSADLIAAGPMQFSQRIELAGDSVIDARAGGVDGRIVFDATIDDDGIAGTSSDLVVLTDTTQFGPDLPTITLRAPVGATSAIDSLSLNIGAGSTQRASLGQQTVVINPGTPDEQVLTVFAPLVPTVIIDPAVLDSLSGVTALGPAGARGMVIRTTGDFALGTGEKMAVSFGYEGRDVGSFVLDGQGRRNIGGETIIQSGFDSNNAPTFAIVTTGGGNVSLSDVTVDGNLVIDAAGAITFTRRAQPSLVLSRPDTFESVNEYYDRILANEIDSGSDLFVNGFMYFNDDPTNTINMGTPFAFDQPRTNLGGSVPLEPENFSFRALIISEAEAQTFFGVPSGSSFSPLLDVRAEGTSGQQSDIQQQAPPEAQSGTVEEATSIGSTAKELLADAGINTRDPEDFLDALLGRALYDDLSSDASGATYATVNRFSRDIAVELAREYTAFFRPPALDENGQPIIDPETGEPQVQDRRGEVRGRLNRALVDYRRQAGAQFDPASFRQFLRTNSDYADAEADMLALESILQKFRVLGLSPREYLRAREVTLTYVKPDRISLAQFIDVVEAQPGQGSTSDLVPLIEEEPSPAADEEPAANPS